MKSSLLRMDHLATPRKWLLPALLVVPIVADVLSTVRPSSTFWPQFLPSLYYASIVIAGLEFGWKAGLVVALVAGACHSVIGRLLLASPFVRLEAQVLAFLVVGFALLEERRRRNQKVAAGAPYGQSLRAEESLEQITTAVNELLRQVRTPFGSIQGAAFILDQNRPAPEKRNEFVEIILSECKRVDDILSELGESTELVPLICRPTDASSMLGEVVRVAALERPDPRVSLRIEVTPDLPRIWCDPVRVEQAIVPFVTSAIEALSGGGEILLTADRQTERARIQLKVLEQTIRGGDAAAGRGVYSSTFEAPAAVRILEARRTVLQHGGTITLDLTGHLKRLLSLTLPLYNGQTRE